MQPDLPGSPASRCRVRFASRLACAAALLCAGAVTGAPLPREVTTALAAASIPASSASVWVQELSSSAPAIRHNASLAINPASTIKLVTTYAALDLLGPAFRWKTEAWTAAPLAGEVLQGDLILKGGGDPKLTFENFWLLLRALRDRGVREIRGDLVLDRTWLDPGPHDPGRFDGQSNEPYNVGPDALLLNFKAFRFGFVPDASRGVVTLTSEPPSSALQIENALKTSAAPCVDWRAQLVASFQSTPAGARAMFGGVYPSACGEHVWNVALLSHEEYIHGVFRSLWQDLGGVLTGRWRNGSVPEGARLLYQHPSESLAEVVRDINKYSNNVMARQLFLDLSAEVSGPPGRLAQSVDLVRNWLDARGLRMPELVLQNGSGLSREERISPEHLGQLLVHAYRSAVMPEFLASLPVVAYDGTMRKRLRVDGVAGQAHIKTGSLSGVRSMAGYLLDRSGRRYALVFTVNHPNAAAAQAAMDALLRGLYERGVSD